MGRKIPAGRVWALEDCTRAQRVIALALAQGATQKLAGEVAGVSESYVWRLVNRPRYMGFLALVDRLTLEEGIAQKAERLRIIKRAVRQRIREDGTVRSGKDLLDWLKFAKDEMDPLEIHLEVGWSAEIEGMWQEYEAGGEKEE